MLDWAKFAQLAQRVKGQSFEDSAKFVCSILHLLYVGG